jgi:two-component system sensor histidine kinase BaeS
VAASHSERGESGDNTSRRPPRRLIRSLALFDENRIHVIGGPEEVKAEKYELRELKNDDRTIGWLGLLKHEYISDPMMAAFIKEQTITFVYLGVIILILAAFIAFLLSRHLLAPIRELAQGTRALSSFQFDTHIAVASQDELGQLAEDFNLMAATLKKYEELRQQWISDISHELRTPLAILKGEIEALQDGIRPLDQGQLESLHAEVLRISKLVDDLHDLSLAESHGLLAKKEPVKPLALLRKMVDHYAERMSRNYLDVELSVGEDDAVIMEGDARRITQLFTNLLENSLRYIDPPGLLKIREQHDQDQLTIRFEDSPPGVPDQSLERIFERLYRVDSSRNRNLGGSGLGLAICRQIAEAHGGSIRAEQASIGGLMVTVTLPIRSADFWDEISI